MCRVGQNRIFTMYMNRIFGDFPAKITVYTSYIYGSGLPYVCVFVCVCVCVCVCVRVSVCV